MQKQMGNWCVLFPGPQELEILLRSYIDVHKCICVHQNVDTHVVEPEFKSLEGKWSSPISQASVAKCSGMDLLMKPFFANVWNCFSTCQVPVPSPSQRLNEQRDAALIMSARNASEMAIR